MASEKTLAVRSEKEKSKDAARAEKAFRAAEQQRAQQERESRQMAAQFITSTAQAIFIEKVLLAHPHPEGPAFETREELFAWYEKQAHAAMDAAIAFVRSSNSYDDRGKAPADAPPIELAPVDANGSPVTE